MGYEIQLLRLSAAPQPEVLLTGPYSSLNPSDWSQDGKFIVFSNRPSRTKDDLWLLPLDGDRKPIPFRQTPANERAARFSPDSHWLAYMSDVSGRYEIYVQRFPSDGGQFQVTSTGGQSPEWSRDGRELFYLEGGQRLMSVPVTLGASFERGRSRPVFDNVRFYLSNNSGAPYQPSSDGKRFLALVQTAEDARPSPITVVTNWQVALQN
jgi:dipeptidyl aminopeptidase/acylaminoacyl peptidase